VEDAQDLTQEFFRRLLAKRYFALADPERGRFRSFLLTALKRFLISEWRRNQALQRGGAKLAFRDDSEAETRYQAEPATDVTPEKLYEKRWALLLLDRVVSHLQEEAIQAGKVESSGASPVGLRSSVSTPTCSAAGTTRPDFSSTTTARR
jgi:RNA polymerase sigma-70 factor (ECF subfamily)